MLITLQEVIEHRIGQDPGNRARVFEDAGAAGRRLLAKLKADGGENPQLHYIYDGFEKITVTVSGRTK